MYKLTTILLITIALIFVVSCTPVEVVVTEATATTEPTDAGTIPDAPTPSLAATTVTTATSTSATTTLTATAVVTGTPNLVETPTPTTTATMTVTDNLTGTAAGTVDQTTAAALPIDMTDMTIAEIISTTQGFSTLAAAVEAAGIIELLDAPGPLTIFAPTDTAFGLYSPDTLDELLASPAILGDLLQYHLIVDRAPIAQLAEVAGATTYLGEFVDITVSADGAYLANDVVITQADIEAANGIIHVVNGVLVPSSADDLLISRTVNPVAETDTGTRDLTLEQLAAVDTSTLTVLEVISSIDGFSTLATAVDAAGLNPALSGTGPITLLAPTNGAFAEISDLELEVLLNAQIDELIRTLQYHTILDVATSADLAQLGTVLTATGDVITFTVDADGVITLNGGAATVFMADIEASNGVVHAISAVLTPPAE